jgi:hypothetical protein
VVEVPLVVFAIASVSLGGALIKEDCEKMMDSFCKETSLQEKIFRVFNFSMGVLLAAGAGLILATSLVVLIGLPANPVALIPAVFAGVGLIFLPLIIRVISVASEAVFNKLKRG